MKTQTKGFTLIELMVVVAVIGILATMALPSFQDRVIRSQVEEALNLAKIAQAGVEEFYRAKRVLPVNNTEAGLPLPQKIIGNYVVHVAVNNGAIDITLGARINKNADGAVISIRPAIVSDAPIVPIAWIYAYASVPEGMTVKGENQSTIPPRFLPVH